MTADATHSSESEAGPANGRIDWRGISVLVLLAPAVIFLGFMSLAIFLVTVVGFPDEVRRASEVSLDPGPNELRIQYGMSGLPLGADQLELRLIGATKADSSDDFVVDAQSQPTEVTVLDKLVCDDDRSCRTAMVSNSVDVIVVNESPVEAHVVVELLVVDDEGIESNGYVDLDVVLR